MAYTGGVPLLPERERGRGGPGGWWVLDEPELHLGAHVVVPDLAGWRKERLPSIPDAPWRLRAVPKPALAMTV